MKIILTTIIICYLGSLLGHFVSIERTGFIPPKGLWKLVPFRVSGWKSPITNKIHKINWSWEDVKY